MHETTTRYPIAKRDQKDLVPDEVPLTPGSMTSFTLISRYTGANLLVFRPTDLPD